MILVAYGLLTGKPLREPAEHVDSSRVCSCVLLPYIGKFFLLLIFSEGSCPKHAALLIILTSNSCGLAWQSQVAYKTAWTAISSLLSQFSRDFGPQVLLHLNVAYFFPSIPVLLLQSAFQERIEQRFGLAGSALARFFIGLGALVLLTATFPAFCHSESWLLAATVLVGMSYGLAFGTSYQLVSKFPKHNTVALTLGGCCAAAAGSYQNRCCKVTMLEQ